MSQQEEDLQNRIEQGEIADSSLDARAYRKVFSSLKKEPYVLPVNFADDVLRRMETAESLSRDYMWFGIGLVAFIVAAAVAVLRVNFRPDFGVLKFINSYAGLFIFAIAFVLLVHVIDKRFLRTTELETRNQELGTT